LGKCLRVKGRVTGASCNADAWVNADPRPNTVTEILLWLLTYKAPTTTGTLREISTSTGCRCCCCLFMRKIVSLIPRLSELNINLPRKGIYNQYYKKAYAVDDVTY
jgi:hypothetical protein